jgi:hypothetical protein
MNGLDDEGRGFLEGSADFYEQTINEVHSSPLFYPQRHDDQSRQEKDDDKSEEGISSKEEKATCPHQSSILKCDAME